MKHIDALARALNLSDFAATPWKNCRVYINGLGKDISAYFTFDEPEADVEPEADLLAGTALKVFTNCAQGQAWKINRAKQVKHDLMVRLFECGISKVEPCAEWRDVIL